jgi:putative selenate reductase molybdopterin-binding subunit
MPVLETIFVETFEPTHPFGVKAVAEIPMDGVAPAVGNAVLDACGGQVDENPVTPERVWRALKVDKVRPKADAIRPPGVISPQEMA